ncbi:hypothetical protein SAMN05428942_0557 [Streptomyces sp. 2112.2]|nr:hypothetical protein SAMN05428943_0558 [Streptomyces sp. 2314.4]SEC72364.1 hypothetical protein SAMN05428942_0557 [Streptomyces sp. 2112.2]SOE15615.1 hypothetical protein SAMN06272775_6515 [Streptomyces sp. 2323.1]
MSPRWEPNPDISYFAGSCGDAPLTVVRQYIENQKRPIRPSPHRSSELRRCAPPIRGCVSLPG